MRVKHTLQLDKIDPLVAPCCSHLSKCTCGHEGGIPSSNSSSSHHTSYVDTLDLSLLFDDDQQFVFPSIVGDEVKDQEGNSLDRQKFLELFGEATDFELLSMELYGW